MTTTITCVSAGGATVNVEPSSLLTAEARDRVRRQANEWIKGLRLVPYGTQTMRERFTYRNDSLWWFTEVYLHRMRRMDAAVAATLALEAAHARHEPARLVVDTNDEVTRAVARAFGRARGVAVDVATAPAHRPGRAWPSYLVGLTPRMSRLRRTTRFPEGSHPAVVAFVHTAFWRPSSGGDDQATGHEGYIGPVLDEIQRRVPAGDLMCVGVGPRRNFRARRWWDGLVGGPGTPASITRIEHLAPARALGSALAFWKRRRRLAAELTTGDAIRDAAVFRGLDLWPVLGRELEDAALVQWPWSARAMDEAAAAIDALCPQVVVTYAEAGGWGRALVLEARRRGVPSVGLQHGFIYRHWLNYVHEADEMEARDGDRGFPAPDRTLLFDRTALEHLTTAGHYRAASLVVTGNARLDDLAARVARFSDADRADVVRSLGADHGQRLAILAAKFSEVAGILPALVRAVAALPDVRLVIKAHPAETADVYGPATTGAANVTVVPADADLARLLAAAQGLVTKNSTVAIDGLVLGVPALVMDLPNNLSPFVDAGVMLGCERDEDLGRTLRTLLYDRNVRQRLADAASAFVGRYQMRADGHAADRAAAAILALRASGSADDGPED
jgi:hypothetical protein